MRLAEEYDAAQERGEVARRGWESGVDKDNITKADDLGLAALKRCGRQRFQRKRRGIWGNRQDMMCRKFYFGTLVLKCLLV